MRYPIASTLILLLMWLASYEADSYSYLATDIEQKYTLLTLACLGLFLIAVALATVSNSTHDGRLKAPSTLAGLICALLLMPQTGIAIGRIVNFGPSLEIMLAAAQAGGARAKYLNNQIYIDGDIGFDTVTSLYEMKSKHTFESLMLESPGGLIDSAIEIGKFLNAERVDAFVTGYCESACVIIALSANRLFVSPESRFGVHRGSATASQETQLGTYVGNIATEQYLSTLRDLGMPKDILEIAENTPATDMYYIPGYEMIDRNLALPLDQ